jgi:hypothetical protein
MDELSDDAAHQAPTVAGDSVETVLVPPAGELDSDLAWSLGDDADAAVLSDHHPWDSAWGRAVLAVGGATAVALLIGIGSLTMVLANRGNQAATAQGATVLVQTSVIALPAPPPVTKTVTVKASPTTVTVQAPPTVTVEAAPTTATVKVPATSTTSPNRSLRSTTPSSVESSNDQRFLNTLRALGYTIGDPQAALRNAHETCRMFQLGESADQVNQELRAKTGAPINEIVQFTSSVMLTYPNCVRYAAPSGSGND